MSKASQKTAEIPPELLSRALGLTALGVGGGLTAGVIEGKPLTETVRDLATGAIGGAAGGGTLGAGLALLGKSAPGSILSRNPLALILTMAGAGAGIGSLLKGGNTNKMPTVQSLIGEAKIGSFIKEAMPQQYQPAPLSYAQQLGANQEALATRQQEMAEKQELDRRVSLGRAVGSPVGKFLGKQLGGAVSSMAGERSVGGIRGFFGATEKRVDPNMARDVGGTLGTLGGSQFGASLARRLQADPRSDMYMDKLGL